MLTKEWKLEDALAVRYDEGREEGKEEGWNECESNIVALLKSGRSPEEIIRDFETRAVTTRPGPETSEPRAQA